MTILTQELKVKSLFKYRIDKCKSFIVIIVIWFVLLIVSLSNTGLKIDEFYYHLPTLLEMKKSGIIQTISSSKYLAANTPLPYIINLLIGSIFFIDLTIGFTRVITALFGLGSILLIYNIFKNIYKTENYLIKTLIVFFYPYFLKPSFTFYMAIYGLFFFLLFLTIYYQKETKYKPLFLGLSLTFAVLSQQFYFSILPLLVIYLFEKGKNNNYFVKIPFKKVLQDILLISLPIILLIFPLFLIWKGLTHPNYSFHKISFDITNISIILVAIGTFLSPFLILFAKNLKLVLNLFFIFLSIVLSLLFYPLFAAKGGYQMVTGITFHLIELISRFNFQIGVLLRIICIYFGILAIYKVVIFILSNKAEMISFSIFFLCVAFIFNDLLAERHLLPLIISLYLFIFKEVINKKYLYTMLTVQTIIGIVYFINYIYFQPSY